MMKKSSSFFYFLSFIEGGCVMAAELLGAKMLAPYFGTSIYVWASVLGVTLGGLALGYYWGGSLSARGLKERSLYYVLVFGAIFLILMPWLARAVMFDTYSLGLLPSIVFSAFICLFPPVCCMGMVSPLIVSCISLLEEDEGKRSVSGKTAGKVYAISTVGGILSTFLMGFYFIPTFGLTSSLFVLGLLMGTIPFYMLMKGKNFIAVLFPLAAFFSLSSSAPAPADSEVRILYSSEGILGQILVADYPLYEGPQKVEGTSRILFVNRSTQTTVTKKNGEESYFEYVHLIDRSLPGSLDKTHALVLGLGGGCVANMFTRHGVIVNAVELDSRMVDVAKNYFNLSDKVAVTIDDARRYVRNRIYWGPKYNRFKYIVLDAFIGEVNPSHLFTYQFFREIDRILAGTGTFFINGHGYWEGEAGKGMRSVCKTLLYSGFDVEVVPTRAEEEYRNLVFIAKRTREDVGTLTGPLMKNLDLGDAEILVDDQPKLEMLNAEANKRWRIACMNYFLNGYYSRQDTYLFK